MGTAYARTTRMASRSAAKGRRANVRRKSAQRKARK